MKTTTELMKIASVGGNLIIDGGKKTTTEIMKIVSIANSNNGKITVKNASKKTTTELMKIASVGAGIVTFDLVD
ncbi:hypothetical protein [Tenacibaculum sp. Ill]|uniref:hypothetical protein n=1 Tax=Tenacibaculum sp. Ill TaxID=3445935 RepID=UPI003F7A9DF0